VNVFIRIFRWWRRGIKEDGMRPWWGIMSEPWFERTNKYNRGNAVWASTFRPSGFVAYFIDLYTTVLNMCCRLILCVPVDKNCIVTARTVKVKTRVHSKPGTPSTRPPRHQLTPQIWCVQQRLIASRLRQETLHWLRSERSAFLYKNKIFKKVPPAPGWTSQGVERIAGWG